MRRRALTPAGVFLPVVYLTGLALGHSGRDCMPSPPHAGHVAREARRASDRALIHIDTQKEKN